MYKSNERVVPHGNKAPETSQPAQRTHGLDALRGLAATGVVFTHATWIHPLGVPFRDWSVGYFGMCVPLFFIISAFSMSLAYPDGISVKSSRAYALRRYFRIAPLFYAMLFAWLWIGLQSTPWSVLRNLTFVFGFVPSEQVSLVPAGWSIGVEAIFYLLFPLLCIWRNLWAATAILILSCLGWAWINLPATEVEVPSHYYWTNFLTNAPYFGLGLFAWNLFRVIKPSWQRVTGLALLVAGTGLVAVSFFWGPLLDGAQVAIKPVPFILTAGWGLGFACLALSLALNPVKFLVNKVTLFLGKISYSIYLSHPFVIYSNEFTRWAATLVDNPNFVVPVVCLLTLCIVLPVATVLYYLVELPFIRYAQRLTKPEQSVKTSILGNPSQTTTH